MKKQHGKKAIYVIRAKKGLLAKSLWQRTLQAYPTSLICSIRERYQEMSLGITEKFNSNSRYFGYWTGEDKDRVYIYVQKKKLVIDLCVRSDFATTLEKQGFKVKPRGNFQGTNGWLTGWQVPHDTKKLNTVMKWISNAFDEKYGPA